MAINVSLIRERTISKYGWTPRNSYDFEIIERETFEDWHRFYPLYNWVIKKKDCAGRPDWSTTNIELELEDLEELYDVLTKVIKTNDKSLFPEGEKKVSENPNIYWNYVGDLHMILGSEIKRERARRETDGDNYSRYFLGFDM